MELTRRYLFNGSAAAYGGRFVRPDDVVLASSGGSAAVDYRGSLGVAGPRHQAGPIVPHPVGGDVCRGAGGQPARRGPRHQSAVAPPTR